MRTVLSFAVLVVVLVACKTTDTGNTSKEEVILTRGMPMSEVVDLLGEPASIKSGVAVGGVEMDSWHYEIVLSRDTTYKEIDTYIEKHDRDFRVTAPKDFVDDAAVQTMVVYSAKIQIMDILVYEDRLFSVTGQVKVSEEKEDWRER